MEIERKFLVRALPPDLEAYPHTALEQAYLCRRPVLRVRREGERYVFTCKGEGLLERQECNLPLDRPAYEALLAKTEGGRVSKTRYRIPYEGLTIELDVFAGALAPLVLAEVEFESRAQALAFLPPDWFGREVTEDPAYTNAALSLAEGPPEAQP